MDTPPLVLNLDTGEQDVLVERGSNPHYSPTGHIVYGIDGALWAVGFDLDRLTLTTSTPEPVLPGVNTKSSGAANFSLSTNGSILYVPGTQRDERDLDRSFVWLDRDGNEQATAPEVRAYQEFRLSPDGTKVAVIVDGDVWIYDLARVTGAPLTFDPETRERFPTWTPDGRRVAFGFDSGELAWKPVDETGEVETLMQVGSERVNPHGFSPDAVVLIFRNENRFGVLSLEGRLETVWPREDTPRNADLSPDGRWLVGLHFYNCV